MERPSKDQHAIPSSHDEKVDEEGGTESPNIFRLSIHHRTQPKPALTLKHGDDRVLVRLKEKKVVGEETLASPVRESRILKSPERMA